MPQALRNDAVALVRAGARGDAAALAEHLVDDYLEAADPDDLAALSARDVAGALLGVLTLAEHRTPGAASVRVGNPTIDDAGWESRHTVIDVVDDDMPFIVDSVSLAVVQRGYDIHLLVHPMLGGVSHLHLEIDRETDRDRLASLHDELESVLADVAAAVHDWTAMRDVVQALAAQFRDDPPQASGSDDADDIAEVATFLEWLADDHFTFLSHVAYERAGERPGGRSERPRAGYPGEQRATSRVAAESGKLDPVDESCLGIARRRPEPPPPIDVLDDGLGILELTKGDQRATVHRAVVVDVVAVRRFGPDGDVVGEHRFTGLYTENVYSQSVSTVPVLRRKAAKIIDRTGFAPSSHDARALAHILESHPRDDLFRLSLDEIYDVAFGVLKLRERRRLRLFVSPDRRHRYVSCLVYLPRDRYTTAARVGILETLREAFGGTSVEYSALVTESVHARLHVMVQTPGGAGDVSVAQLEAQLARFARAWSDDLRDELVRAHGEEPGLERFSRWVDAFPVTYQAEIPAAEAVGDLAMLEHLDPDADLQLAITNAEVVPSDDATSDLVRLKLYRSGGALVLSDVMPLLEQLGVRVIDERPYEIAVSGEARCWIYSFRVRTAVGHPLTDPAAQARIAELFLGVWAGTIENDGLNRLVLCADLTAREVVIVRALCRYLLQAGVRFTERYLADTLADNPDATRACIELFHARLDPARTADTNAVTTCSAACDAAVDAVITLDADRILRALVDLIRAIVRTNAYQDGADECQKPYLAIKLDAERLEFLPRPRPRHEIWVYAPEVEGVHLRAGDVARGGIRWSDRREDFRTEILGLMKAQMVKNAVIVPVGAKGGFVVKRPLPSDLVDAHEHVLHCYQVFIRGLLDLTDNLVDGVVVPPRNVVRHDDDDAYLVVAADKGTATFSDHANELAAEYGYWLGDAFASGGSAGFDHKAMAITSRGAWISARAHFRALGIDADTEELSVVGIGDMSGDVFGNGLLRSPHLKLIAAFDHRHVFVDPDPDPARSFEERRRLFALPASSWADYDPSVLSPGGAVYPRGAKAVDLAPEARRALGIEAETLTPDALIAAVLRAPVDLLWNGGIGTFVKASTESHADVGDRTNDAVRVDADQLRCRVVVEGGNLGFTQRARVEYALAEGRINTDAIDNSAGVDCSDHEVNIKILLTRAVAQCELAPTERDQLLALVTDDVANLVLADNEAQANALEIAAVEAPLLVGVHAREMERLERIALLDRALEALPNARTLQERIAARVGLTSPELAVLLAYTKLWLDRELLASDLPDDPYLQGELMSYFPAALLRFSGALESHPLHREIIATAVSNTVVNRAGITFLSRLSDETGMPLAVLARAHIAAREVFAAGEMWSAIDALDLAVPAAVQDTMFLTVRRLTERGARHLVRGGGSLELAPTIAEYGPPVHAVVDALADLLEGAASDSLHATASAFVGQGVPEGLAARVAGCESAVDALFIAELARVHGENPLTVARTHFVLAARLGLDRVRERIGALPRADRWQTEARAALRDDFYDAQRELTEAALTRTSGSDPPDARADAWLGARHEAVARYQQVVDDLETAGTFDLSGLAVARRALRALAESP